MGRGIDVGMGIHPDNDNREFNSLSRETKKKGGRQAGSRPAGKCGHAGNAGTKKFLPSEGWRRVREG